MGAGDPIAALVRRHGGLIATHELHRAGVGRQAISIAVRERRLFRVRQGWYGPPGLHPVLLRAARVGGRATCSTALDLSGIWVMGDRDLHVAVVRNSCQHRRPGDAHRRLQERDAVRRHWTDSPPGASRLIVGPTDALRDDIACGSPELIGAAFDSLLNRRPDLAPGIRRLISSAPRRLDGVLGAVDGSSESGTEFLFRWRMRGLGVRMRPQVDIHGVGRVDFVLGERLVVELDGWDHHGDRAQFEEDRRRDAALSRLDYRCLRFSFQQVMDRWPDVDLAVRAAVARRDHL
jgi:very-short-patch-repair endonuclease